VPIDTVRAAYSRAPHVEVIAEAGWDPATLGAFAS
jgi:hypothetical protein